MNIKDAKILDAKIFDEKIPNIRKPNSAVYKKDDTHYDQTGFILEMQGQLNT